MKENGGLCFDATSMGFCSYEESLAHNFGSFLFPKWHGSVSVQNPFACIAEILHVRRSGKFAKSLVEYL